MRRFLVIFVAMIVLGSSYAFWALNRQLPTLKPVNVLATLPADQTGPLTWPAYGGAAVGAVGYGVLAAGGKQTPVPTASVAKVMTALAVLQKHPLKPGEQGPTLTLGSQDVDFYNRYVAVGGSVVPVNYGEEISEYQALQALLLPSANNMAETLAVWAFGSVDTYTSFANTYAKQLGLTGTHIADASGFSPGTTSTPADLVRLGEASSMVPVVAQIVAQTTADIPVAGTIRNINEQLGQNGINGIKTGNTDAAGGVYLVSASYTVGSRTVQVVAAITGAPTLVRAMQDALPLLASARANFVEKTVVRKDQAVGYYNTAWHTSANAVASADLKSFGWKGTPVKPTLVLKQLQAPAAPGQTIGTLTFKDKTGNIASVPVTLQQSITTPTWQWRLLHP